MKKLFVLLCFFSVTMAAFSQPLSSAATYNNPLDSSFYVPVIYQLNNVWYNRKVPWYLLSSAKLDTGTAAATYITISRFLDSVMAIKGIVATRLSPADTVGKWITSIFRKQGSDSVFYYKGAIPVFAFRDSIGSGSAGGSGTVTSIAQGAWMANSANPITNSGTLNVDSSAIVARMKQIAHDSITPIKNISLWTDDYTIKGNSDSVSPLHVDTTVMKTVWRARQDSIALAAAGGGGGVGAAIGANMYRLAAQTFSAGADTKVLLDNTQFDNSGTMADLTNHRLNIPSTGLYIITIFARLSNGGAGECEMKVKLNGNTTEFMRAGILANSNGDALQLNNSMVVSLTASDYIELFINPAFSASSLGTSYPYLAPRITIAKIK